MQSDDDISWDGQDGDGLASVTPIRYGLFESTVAQIVARAYRVNPLDASRDDYIHVMGGVIEAMESRERMRRIGWHGTGDDSYASRISRLVEYLRDGYFISDLHEDDDACRIRVQMTWDEVLATLAKKSNASKPSRVFVMEQLDWFRLETAVDGGELLGRSLAREIGISPTSLGTLVRLYQRAGRTRTPA